jgi:hypothetical protein
MGTQAKGVVQVVLPKNRKDGTPAWEIIIDNVAYYDSKGNFKDETGKEINFEWEPSKDGNIKFINPVGGGGFTKGGGGGGRGKSPEEIALQKKAFALSYAKDQVNVITSAMAEAGSLALPKEVKLFEFMEMLRQNLSTMTIRTAREFISVLEGTDQKPE